MPITGISDDRVGDIRIYITDNSKVTEKTGWKPEITVDQIIKKIAGWVGDNPDLLMPILA